MSEHWFDALSRPRDRRAALKAALVAGSALLVPAVRVPRAWATEREPCFVPCQNAARNRWNDMIATCAGVLHGAQLGMLGNAMFGNAGGAVLLGYLARAEYAGCLGSGELTYHRASLACRGSECGDPDKYPGGATKPKPPPPKCDQLEEKACGDICCNVITDCCSSKKGGYVCYAAGYNCEGA